MELIPHCLTPKEHFVAFAVWLGLVSSRPLAHPVPYLHKTTLRLYLNTFRGEPAISEFDWHFTSTHSSSQHFATYTGSVLHSDIIRTSTWPWVAHSVSGLIQTTHQAHRRRHLRHPLGFSSIAPTSPERLVVLNAASAELPAPTLPPPDSRPIRTRFRCGSGTDIP